MVAKKRRGKRKCIPLFSWDEWSKIQENKLLRLLIDYPIPVLSSCLKALDVLLELVPILNTLYNLLFRWDCKIYPASLLGPIVF